jgi:hypothetical protein
MTNYLNIVDNANKLPVVQISPGLKKELISEEEVIAFIQNLGRTHNLTDGESFVAIALLFLKGAGNSSAPKSMSVDITVQGSPHPINITKYDIEYSCHNVTGNWYLRRFAEAMSKEISEYAARNNLNGDLAIRLNNLAISKGGPPLNTLELAWASSFCQNRVDLSSLASERLATLLAEDFQKRFGNKKKKESLAKEKNLSPRQWRQAKPKAKENTTVSSGKEAIPPASKKKKKLK